MKYSKLSFAFFISVLYACTAPIEKIDLPEKKLITTDYFHNRKLIPDNIIFIDCRINENFKDAHIPEAVHLWRDEISDSLGLRVNAEKLSEVLGKKGISHSDTIVIYDSGDAGEASRLWWLLDCYGFKEAYILEGGFEKWKRDGMPLSTDIKIRKTKEFTLVGNAECKYLAEKEDVLSAIKDNAVLILDVRSDAEYYSNRQDKFGIPPGRIPGSLHMEYTKNLQFSDDGTFGFKGVNELKELYSQIGIDENTHVLVYCHSGVRSSQTVFVLSQLLGFKHVKNYDGSWKEWSRNPELPIEQMNALIK